MKIYTYKPNILIATFETEYHMSATLMRIQEFTEGDFGFKGKIFSEHEFLDAYYERHGKMDYYENYFGFTFSKAELNAFFNEYPNRDMTDKEHQLDKAILKHLSTPPNNRVGDYHLICVSEEYKSKEEGSENLTADNIIPDLLKLIK